MKKHYVIGDIHGHHSQFLRLYNTLKQSGFNDAEDVLVFVGDVVDGGDETKQFLDWIIDYQTKYPQTVCLMGNHEHLLLDALVWGGQVYGSYDLWWGQGGRETFQSFIRNSGLTAYEKSIIQVKDVITSDYLDWLINLPYYYSAGEYFIVHGGLIPNKTIKEHTDLLDKHDRQMEETVIWMREPFITSRYNWGQKIVFGHTVFPYGSIQGTDPDNNEKVYHIGYPYIDNYKIGIDGMHHNEGSLIAFEIPSAKFYFERTR